MNERFRLSLLLILSALLFPRMATAQRFNRSSPPLTPAPHKQSHREVPGFDLSNVHEMMAERLKELHELHQLQDQVQELLKNEDFLKHMQQQQFTEADLQKLRDKIPKGQGLSQDADWARFLNQASKWHKLDDRHIEMLRRFAERAEHKSTPSRESGSIQDRGPVASPPHSVPPSGLPTPSPSPPPSGTPSPEPSFIDRMQAESTKWLMENFDDVGGSMLEALTQMDANADSAPLAELLRNMRQSDFAGMDLGKNSLVPRESVAALTNSLSGVGDFLSRQGGVWNELRYFLQDVPVPSLPNLGGPSVSVPASSASTGGSWAPAFLSLLMLATIVFLLCKKSFGSTSPASSGAGGWRIGSWPVSPAAVSTRQDVIRAFEYLALLCLGPTAAACNHRELGERLAGQDSDKPGRRQAAEMLAWLYEQARYVPAEEALSHEQLSDARHALCLLAGVTAL